MRRLGGVLGFPAVLALAAFLPPLSGAQGPVSGPGATLEQIAGKVVTAHEGHPIAHASLSLQETKTGKVVAETSSGDAGSFRFDPVPPGRYRLTGTAKGYLPAAYLQHDALSSAIVTGVGLQTGALVLELTRSATVGGRILDEAGEPVQRATVALYRERAGEGGAESSGGSSAATGQRLARVRSTQTGDDGRYEFRNLEEGRYFLAANGTPWYAVHAAKDDGQSNGQMYRTAVDPALDVAYPTIYYPGALRSDQASAIALHGGEETTADLQMLAVPAVTLTLGRPPGTGGTQFPTLTHTVFGVPEPVSMQGVFFNGTQQITGLAPGEYGVQQFGDGNRAPVPLQTVDLTAGSATVNLAPPANLGTVTVQVRALPGATLPAGLQLNLRDLRLQRRYAGTRVDDKGGAEFANVAPGEYRPVLFHEGRPVALGSVAVNGKPAPDRQVRLTEGAHLDVAIVAAGEPVTLTGVVERNGKPAVGVLMVLVPAGADTSEDLFRRDQTDLDGGFTCANVAPGDYIAVAIEDGWPLHWTDVRALGKYLPHGVPVAVPAGGPRTMQLREAVIPQAP